jgi:hypothetical protein
MLPPAEIDVALLKIIEDNFGASRSELTQAASWLFGFQSLGVQLRGVLEDGIARLVAVGKLVEKDQLLIRAKP